MAGAREISITALPPNGTATAARRDGTRCRIAAVGRSTADVSVLGFYSPSGGRATATLLAPDGRVRGTRAFSFASNIAQEFNPAASAFGVAAEPRDVVLVSVDSGVLQPYVSVQDSAEGGVLCAGFVRRPGRRSRGTSAPRPLP